MEVIKMTKQYHMPQKQMIELLTITLEKIRNNPNAEEWEKKHASNIEQFLEKNKNTEVDERKQEHLNNIFQQQWKDRFIYELNTMEMTQKELAQKTGLSQNTISNYKNSLRIPTLSAFVSICKALDLSADEIFELGAYKKK